MNYKEKLLDPRWQKKRLEILDRDNFTCQLCDDDKSTLHVHHNEYSTNPWDVNNEKLITYCEHCHQFMEFTKNFSTYKSIIKIVKHFTNGGVVLNVLNIDKDDKKCIDIHRILSNRINDIEFIYFIDFDRLVDFNNLFNNN